ncbi:MAG: CHAT domain-containing protein [Pseudodesulfovibrio sp.]
MSQGEVIHFACHGIFNPADPLASGLIMAPTNGSAPNRLEDINPEDLLKVTDIMGLKINPNLVFLSACDTARAKIGSGDEIIGLTRGFFVAGAPSVINTLWKIDDQSTAMLAKRFYENMLKKGMDKAEALKEAKLYVMQKGFKEPYYWAAFVLQGDWQ